MDISLNGHVHVQIILKKMKIKNNFILQSVTVKHLLEYRSICFWPLFIKILPQNKVTRYHVQILCVCTCVGNSILVAVMFDWSVAGIVVSLAISLRISWESYLYSFELLLELVLHKSCSLTISIRVPTTTLFVPYIDLHDTEKK